MIKTSDDYPLEFYLAVGGALGQIKILDCVKQVVNAVSVRLPFDIDSYWTPWRHSGSEVVSPFSLHSLVGRPTVSMGCREAQTTRCDCGT